MRKTLLLCFIHGFKGGEATFGDKYSFTEDLRRLVAEALPKVNVRVAVYPKYETRGDLGECVARFRDWLLEKVIDLEVAAHTPSPTVDPSVRVVLIGHSMGGIVAAEALISLTSDQPVPPSEAAAGDEAEEDRADEIKAKDESKDSKAKGDFKGQAEEAQTKEKTNSQARAKSNGGNGKTAKQPPPPSATLDPSKPPTLNAMMFPYIQGVLAFDTPYLGISPGVVAHGAEGHFATASEVVTQLGALSALWSGGNSAAASAATAAISAADGKASGKAPAKTASRDSKPAAADGSSAWGKWGRYAMYAGAGAALAGTAAAAYLKRENIAEGWTWASSHLEFVGCLARGEELRRRVAYMARADRELGVGFANLYTRLGDKAGKISRPQPATITGAAVMTSAVVLGRDRTFCNLPSKTPAGEWKEAVNEMQTDEAGAHMAMFERKENPGYDKLAGDAKDLIVKWTSNEWYSTSDVPALTQGE